MFNATANRGGLKWTDEDFADLAKAHDDDGEESTSSASHKDDGDADDEALPPPTSVQQLRAGASNLRVSKYLADFDKAADDDASIYCALPTGVVEDAARAQTLAAGIAKEDSLAQHKNELAHIEALKRNRLREMDAKRQQRRSQQDQALRDIELVRQQTNQLVRTYYEHASLELNVHLTTRQGEISQQIGEIRKYTRGDYDPNKPDWSSITNNMKISVNKIKGIKNKIPRGDYVVLVSKWDKLGGVPLQWFRSGNTDKKHTPDMTCPIHGMFSPAAQAAAAKQKATGITETNEFWRDQRVKDACEICQGWAGGTPVTRHEAKPKDYSMNFDGSVVTFFPSQNEIKPYNALVFELVRLPPGALSGSVDPLAGGGAGLGTSSKTRPEVVGWGVMPIVDSHFNLINGKFRFPMLRGPYVPRFGHFKTIQDAILDDLENWLGNVYIDVNPEPRYHFGISEFELQRNASGLLLELGHEAEDDSAKLVPHYDSAAPDNHYGWPFEVGRKRGASIHEDMEIAPGRGGSLTAKPAALERAGTMQRQGTMQRKQSKLVMGQVFGFNNPKEELFAEEEFLYKRPEIIRERENDALTRWGIIKSAIDARRREKIAADNFAQLEAIRRAEASKVFRYAIHPFGSTMLQSVWRAQVEYCIRAIKDEMSLMTGPASAKFWGNIFVFLLCAWLNLYVHTTMQYVSLRALGVPTTSVGPEWWGLRVEYSHLQTKPLEELCVAFFSMSAMYWLLLFQICFGWVCRAAAGTIPETLSKFVFSTAISGVFVPLLDLVVDWSTGMERSDWYRLQSFFEIHQYGLVYVWVAFVVMYLLLMTVTTVSTFLFTMALHLNGILQDAYWRIVVVNEDTCYIPDDLEVSVQELHHIVDSAERWRGMNGERRKVVVNRLTTTDKDYPDYVRQDLHVMVRQLRCDTSEEWFARKDEAAYREFYVLQEGTILETVVGGAPSGVGFVLNAIADKAKRRAWRKKADLDLSSQSMVFGGNNMSMSMAGGDASGSGGVAGFFGDRRANMRRRSGGGGNKKSSAAVQAANQQWGR